jgi:hypothetical protein
MCLFEREEPIKSLQGGTYDRYCMAFRHRDPRMGRLIETVEVFLVKEVGKEAREHANGRVSW